MIFARDGVARQKKSRRGAAAVELAVLLPLLIFS